MGRDKQAFIASLPIHSGGVGLVALLLAAACMAALLLVALFPATDLPPSETYLFYAYCVLVIRARTYEYACLLCLSSTGTDL